VEEDGLPMSFGLAVRRARSGLGLTQQQLADQAALDRSYLSELERGTRNPTLTVQVRLAEALGVRLSDLIRQAEEMD
jgi:transcriptional regulator with XRE-family HTH domain